MHKILFLLATGLIYLLSRLPMKVLYFLASLLGFILFRIFGYRRDVITINIARSFPSLKYKEVLKIRRGFYRNFCDIVAENIKFASISKRQLKRLAIIENPQVLKKFHERCLPLVIIGAHMGNWEIMSNIINVEGGEDIGYDITQLCCVYKQQHSRLSDDIVKWTRLRGGGKKLVESGLAARTILRNKEKPICYFLFSDQSPKPGSKFRVSFLGQQTFMINGPELISKAAGLPVVFMEVNKIKRGRYILRFHEITENSAECEEGFVTGKFAELLESSITSNPSNWLWSHKRWKRGLEDNVIKKNGKNKSTFSILQCF